MTIHAVRSIKYGIALGAIKDAIVALRTEAQHENFRPPVCYETPTMGEYEPNPYNEGCHRCPSNRSPK